MKSTASLTAALLARKGQAKPARTNGVVQHLHHDEPVPAALIDTGRKNGERRIAMTLRLDEDRHVKLRLLSALTGRSCQHLLLDALDHMLAAEANHLDPQVLRHSGRQDAE